MGISPPLVQPQPQIIGNLGFLSVEQSRKGRKQVERKGLGALFYYPLSFFPTPCLRGKPKHAKPLEKGIFRKLSNFFQDQVGDHLLI
jgi:hypothetical protein